MAGVPDLMLKWRIKGEGVGEVVELGKGEVVELGKDKGDRDKEWSWTDKFREEGCPGREE